MILNYANVEFDAYGRPEVPVLELRTLSGDSIGCLSGVTELRFNIKYSEPSEISFTVHSHIDGMSNPFYDFVTGFRVIYTKFYGVYVIMSPETKGDGMEEKKVVTGYSLEKTLDFKRFFLEEGTFEFWNPNKPDDTILGKVLEAAVVWKLGYVAPALIGRYRTFEEYDDYLLGYLMDDAAEKFRCNFVFDVYSMTIHVYDVDAEVPTMPIYLDYDNLLKNVDVKELSDELKTAVRPRGEGELDIRVANLSNPWIYDISWFISHGDIPEELAAKWKKWQETVEKARPEFKMLVIENYMALCRRDVEQAELKKLEQELIEVLDLQNEWLLIWRNAATKEEAQKAKNRIKMIGLEIAEKRNQIAECKNSGSAYDQSVSYAAQMQTISDSLKLKNYFTEEEYKILSAYFIEQDMTETSFVAVSVDTSASGTTHDFQNSRVTITGADVKKIVSESGVELYDIKGGVFLSGGQETIRCDVIRAAMEKRTDGTFTFTMSGGSFTKNGSTTADSGVTATGTCFEILSSDASFSFQTNAAIMVLSGGSGSYQEYTVAEELYEYAKGCLKDSAQPTYEFTIDSANFLFAKEFQPFRDSLKLGDALWLRINDKEVITPILIEMAFSFEEMSEFSMGFSNRVKMNWNALKTFRSTIRASYLSGKALAAKSYSNQEYLIRSVTGVDRLSSETGALRDQISMLASSSYQDLDGYVVSCGGADD